VKILKNIAKGFLIVLVIANVALWITGNTHLYKGLSDTYFQGRLKPSVDNPDLFHTRVLEAGETKSWSISKSFGSSELSADIKKTNSEFGTLAYLVIHKDSIVHEDYYEHYSKNTLSNSFSMAKTILSIITGAAVKEGKVDVNASVHSYIPEFITEKDSALKVKHLLTMTSGMNFRESYGNPFGFMAKAYYGTNLRSLTSGYELEKTPGIEHSYLGGNNLLLSFLLEKATGKKVSEYGSEKIWSKLGMENDGKWILDHEDGDEKTFSGVYATARDYAKLGELYINKGNAYGEQLVDTAYVNASIAPVNIVDTKGINTDYYGYSWWLTKYDGHDVFYLRGILGQYVFCIPDKDLIIVRLGKFRNPTKTDGINPDDIWVYIKEGFSIIE
jgi:CubicO group peptidase (beta-lactamase class C family)